MRMKTTNLGLPSSSSLGRGGGGLRWYCRAAIPFLPLASTTINLWCFGLTTVLVLVEKSECLTSESSCILPWEDKGNRTSVFRDIPTSIIATLSLSRFQYGWALLAWSLPYPQISFLIFFLFPIYKYFVHPYIWGRGGLLHHIFPLIIFWSF